MLASIRSPALPVEIVIPDAKRSSTLSNRTTLAPPLSETANVEVGTRNSIRVPPFREMLIIPSFEVPEFAITTESFASPKRNSRTEADVESVSDSIRVYETTRPSTRTIPSTPVVIECETD